MKLVRSEKLNAPEMETGKAISRTRQCSLRRERQFTPHSDQRWSFNDPHGLFFTAVFAATAGDNLEDKNRRHLHGLAGAIWSGLMIFRIASEDHVMVEVVRQGGETSIIYK